MRLYEGALPALLLISGTHAGPSLSKRANDTEAERAAAVVRTFQTAWDGYKQYAFPNDELHPVTNSFGNPRNAWGASAIDGLDTAIMMGLSDVVEEILDYVPKINYFNTSTEVSLFETTIRYLGGMLSAYDLLHDGPASNLTNNTASVDALLSQSKNLADALKFAFNTPSGIPYNDLNFSSNSSTDTSNGLATIGSLVMEWTRLSDLLGDKTYAELAQKGESYLLNPQYAPGYASPWPGLLGTNVNISNGLFLDDSGGWNGGDDSYYEYLIKMWVYDSDKYSTYRDAWIQAADSSIDHLASHPSSRSDLTFLAAFEGQQLSYESGHLACFDGGNFLLAGAVLNETKYIDFGLQLVNACYNTYNSTATKIGPDGFAWSVNGTGVPSEQTDFYDEHGFWITSPEYILRPEVMESYYYAYRITKDTKYREYAWEGYQAIDQYCRTGSGYAELQDVNKVSTGFMDVQDSFFLAEVLKYAYLIHAPEVEYQANFNGSYLWVFNTEAHAFKVAGTPLMQSQLGSNLSSTSMAMTMTSTATAVSTTATSGALKKTDEQMVTLVAAAVSIVMLLSVS